jgi:hypothetical protein
VVEAGRHPHSHRQSVSGGDTAGAAGQQTVLNGRIVAFVTLDGAAAAAGRGAVVLSWSSDGGRRWHNRTILRTSRPILMPSLSAGRRGQLGLVYDEVDATAASCSPASIPTRTRFRQSSDAGAHWSTPVTVGAPKWNLASGARGTGGFSGYFVGDYQSLAPIPHGFTTATVQGRPLGTRAGHQPSLSGDTGVMVARIRD